MSSTQANEKQLADWSISLQRQQLFIASLLLLLVKYLEQKYKKKEIPWAFTIGRFLSIRVAYA